MPKITIYFIRSGMIFFFLALFLALIMSLEQSGLMTLPVMTLQPVFWHFLLVGWITQIIMGVSVWMFPRKRRGQQGGGEKHAWIAFSCINVGLWMRAISEPFVASGGSDKIIPFLIALSAVLQIIGGTAYVLGIWPRVKGKRKRRRG